MAITALTTINGEIQSQPLNDNFSLIASDVNTHEASTTTAHGINTKIGRVVQTTATDTADVLDLKNFGLQGTGSDKRSLVIHNYTDGDNVIIDNVGTGNTILKLTNANNPINRPDKAANFVGDGTFINCMEYQTASATNLTLFYLSKLASFIWTGVKGAATFIQDKTDTSTEAFKFIASTAHSTFMVFTNNLTNIFLFKNDVAFTRATIESHIDQTSGLFLNAQAGIVTISCAGDRVSIQKPICLVPQTTASVTTGNSIFVDSSDGVLKFKDAGGVTHALYP